MKIFAQIIISVGLALWLAISSLDIAGRFFIKDVIELHGSQVVGANINIESSSISLVNRALFLSDLCFPDVENSPLFCTGLISVHFAHDFSPGFKWKGFFPDFWIIESIEVKDVKIFYDIDSNGDNIQGLGHRLLRDSLNAKAKDVKDPILIGIKEIRFHNLEVRASSKKKSDLSRSFGVGDVVFTDVGLQEEGITAVEILNQIARTIVDGVLVEADKQGLIEKPRSAVNGGSSRKRAAATEDSEVEDSGVKNDFRDLGEGIKDTSKKLWKNTKDIFN